MKVMNKMFQKLCSFLLTALFVISAVPVNMQTFAAPETSWGLEASMVGSNVNVTVTKGGDEPALLLVATYKDNGTLDAVERRAVTITGDTAIESFTLEELQENSSVKVFLWDKDTYLPLTRAIIVEAEIELGDTIVHYDMSKQDGYLTDVSGYKNHAKLNNLLDSDFVDRLGDKILELPGRTNAYAILPLKIVDNLDYKKGFTIEVIAKPRTDQHQFLWTVGTGYQTNYIFLNPRLPNDGTMNAAIKTGSTENNIPNSPRLDRENFSIITVTSDGNTLRSYVNGVYRGLRTHQHNLDTIFAGNGVDILGYIAKSNWDDPYCDAIITDFKIYSRTLSDSEVLENYNNMSKEQIIYKDLEALSLPEYILDDISLPSTGKNGSEIKWTSSNPDVLGSSGQVNRKDNDVTVKLTASVYNSATGKNITKDFHIIVVAAGDSGLLNFFANKFDLGISYVTEDITLITEFSGIKISWEGNQFISDKGVVTRPDQDTKVNLKATFSTSGSSITREFPVTVAAKTSGFLATFIARYEYDFGAEFAEFPSGKYTDNARTDVMYYALSENGVSYTALNNNKAILNPVSLYKMGSPTLFRKPDGSYGAIASVDNNSPQILVFDSEDLVFFDNQKLATLNTTNIVVKHPVVKYDNGSLSYNIYWVGGNGNSYVTNTKDFIAFSDPIVTNYSKAVFNGELPEYASADEASVFELTAEEYDRLEKKLGRIHNVGTDEFEAIKAPAGTKITLPETAKVNYNDGSYKNMSVDWDVIGAGLDLNNPQSGTYQLSGKIKREVYVSPLAECRADPYVVYNEQDKMYYFTSSYMQPDLNNAYSRLIVRKASTINGLKTAQEVVIWNSSKPDGHPWYWAPELHLIGGKWRMIVQAAVYVSGSTSRQNRCVIYTCEGGDMTNPNHWVMTGAIGPSTDGKLPGSFDTTFFEYEGQGYFVSPSSSSLWIAKFNTDDPMTITSEFVRISRGDVGFEHNTSTKQTIQEGSSVIIHGDRIFILYASATVDMHYGVSAMYADVNSNLMDPENWKKYPYPLLASQDLTTTIKQPVFNSNGAVVTEGEYKGTFGPGHNSVTVDENGNYVIIYHARDWDDKYTEGTSTAKYGLLDPGRHAYANNIHFGADGFPICNMTPEQQLASEFENVSITVEVEKLASDIPGLVAQYKFDEKSGTIAYDSSPNGYNATIVGSVNFGSDEMGDFLHLNNGSGQYVDLPKNILEKVPGDFTISTWVNAASAGAYSRIFDFGPGNSSNIMFLTANLLQFNMNNANAIYPPSSYAPGNNLGKWQFLTVTRQGNRTSIWVDGKVIASGNQTSTGNRVNSSYNYYIGRANWNDPYPNMKILDFRIYDRALDESEVNTIMSGGKPRVTASCEINSLLAGFTGDIPVKIVTGGVINPVVNVKFVDTAGKVWGQTQAGSGGNAVIKITEPLLVGDYKIVASIEGTELSSSLDLDVRAYLPYSNVAVYARTGVTGVYSSYIANSVHFAYSSDGINYTPLFNNYGVLFAKATFSGTNSIEAKCVARPYIFRLADDSFGIIAARVNSGGTDDPDSKGKLLFWQSKDLYNFTEPELLDLQMNSFVRFVMCENVDGQYYVKWSDDSGNYYKNAFNYDSGKVTLGAATNSDAFRVNRIKSNIDGANEGNAIELSDEFGQNLLKKWAQVENVAVEVPTSVTVSSADELKNIKATAVYSDGSTHEKSVDWDMGAVNFDVPGTYIVSGTVKQNVYPFPVDRNWGDPVVMYRNNKYYYIATNDSNGNIGFEVREADSVANLFVSGVKRSTILDYVAGLYSSQFWAPEFHEINGGLYILFAVSASGFNPQAHMMKLKAGGDIMKAEDWETPIRVLKKDGSFLSTSGITIDMNYFEAGGKSYLSWSYRTWSPTDSGSMIYLASVDKNEPWKLTSDPVLMTRPVYGWENVDKTDNNEGSYALVTDDTVYLPYSVANAGGDTYALGMMSAKIGDNLLDINSWTKSQRPILMSNSIAGEYGPGHHSTFVDERGDTYMTYHGHTTLGNTTRIVGIRRVHFAADGRPLFDMSADRDLKAAFKTVQITVKV